MMAATALLAGCDTGGKLAISSQSNPGVAIKSGFESGLYRLNDLNNIIVLLYDGELSNPDQAVIIRTQWIPRIDRTPIAEEATNATIRYIIFPKDEKDTVAVYVGAGYIYPTSKLGRRHFRASVWHANLRLTDGGDRYEDQLGQATLTGHFTAKHDAGAISQALRQISRRMTQRLGYPQYVRADNVDGHDEPMTRP